ncbi:Fic family protein [Brachybacterium hainanense]|uniref:Fic family protein n=1 Tax=Brachybacterium hainanense TaxID=1541174 RepID=A0ABV6RBU2_9MICO
MHAQMSDLLDFANQRTAPHMQLTRMAVAHHRFVWIHPFTNGNGRVARLFSYAMIRSYGFAPDIEYQTVNPTTVFGADREQYYARLAAADSLEDDGLVEWVDFVLGGLQRDMDAMHRLTRAGALEDLVARAVDRARRSAMLDDVAARALTRVADGTAFKAGDLAGAIGMDPSGRSRLIAGLLDRRLIERVHEGGRVYRVRLSPNDLTPFVFAELDALGMAPAILQDPPSRPVGSASHRAPRGA